MEPIILTDRELNIERIADIAMSYISGLMKMIDYEAEGKQRILWRTGPYRVFYEGGNTVFRRVATTAIAFEDVMLREGAPYLAVEVHLAKAREGIRVDYLIVRGGSNYMKLKEIAKSYSAQNEDEAATAVLDIAYRVVARFQSWRGRPLSDFKGVLYMTELAAIAIDERLDKVAIHAPGIWHDLLVLTKEGWKEVR